METWIWFAIVAAIIIAALFILTLFAVILSGRHSRREDAGELERAIIRAANDPANRKRV